jgi:hypothetical protein
MQLVARILVVLAAVGGPAVVLAIGCNVESSQFPGLPNELPNLQGVPVSLPSTTSTGTSSTTSSSSSSGATLAAESLCDCAYSLVSGSSSCQTCMTANCQNQFDACQSDPNCPTMGTTCVFNCAQDGTCIANCITSNASYEALMTCLFTQGCASSCPVATTLTCPLPAMPDAGDGG